MVGSITANKAYGDGSEYNPMVLSGSGFTAARIITANSITAGSAACAHAAITIDSNGQFSDEVVLLPRIAARGNVTITCTESGGTPASGTLTYAVQHCNQTTPELVAAKAKFNRLSTTKATYYDTTTSPTTEEVERIIKGVEDTFTRETGVPVRTYHRKRYFSTDGDELLCTGYYPIVKVKSAKYWSGAWTAITTDDWASERDDSKSFWWDERGNVRFETAQPSEYDEGFYMDFIVAEKDVPYDIVQAIEAKTAAIILQTKDFVTAIKRGNADAEIIEVMDQFEKQWTTAIERHRRLVRPDSD